MTIRMAINGFGRIGRMVFRRAMAMDDIEIVAVNGTASPSSLFHLLKYDSTHGVWNVSAEVEDNEPHRGWKINGQFIRFFCTRNPGELPWGELDVDVVVEATGQFCTRETAAIHLRQGAKRVLITAPVKGQPGADLTIVMGVNDECYRPDLHYVLSGASCTTNCLAPVVDVLHRHLNVQSGVVTTIHSITNDQRNLDNPHTDLRRARSCGQSIIPTSTGAAAAIGLVIPSLDKKLNGLSLRVPTPNVSVLDLVVQVSEATTATEVNELFKVTATHDLVGILGYTDEPLVSVDFTGNPHSAIVDGLSTMVMSDKTIKVIAWYDNEWGYASRMVDIVRLIGQRHDMSIHESEYCDSHSDLVLQHTL